MVNQAKPVFYCAANNVAAIDYVFLLNLGFIQLFSPVAAVFIRVGFQSGLTFSAVQVNIALVAHPANHNLIMASPVPCVPECSSTPIPVQVPGAPGADGAAGPNTVTAATTTTLTGILTGDGANVGFVADPLPIANGGTGAATQALALAAILGGAPLPIANGGTAGATKAAGQTALGLGQNALVSTSSGLSQVITNSYAQVGTVSVTIGSTGIYLLMGRVSIDMVGVTFAASRVISFKIRNVTQGTDLVTANRDTQILTTINYPTLDWALPFLLDTTPVAGDILQLMITINTVNSAGTLSVVAGSMVAVPLRYS